MGMILKFVARSGRNDRPAGKSDAGAPKQPCEIILFPGVRYERWSGDDKPAPQKKGAKKRKRATRRA